MALIFVTETYHKQYFVSHVKATIGHIFHSLQRQKNKNCKITVCHSNTITFITIT